MMIKQERKKILLVEDETLIALYEKKQLELYNYKVEIVSDGENAIKYVKKNNDIDLILMDINLGSGLDGTETSQIILKEKDIPIVFLSSHTNPEIVKKTEKITSYGYVVKNTSITVLDASIKMAFKLHNAKIKEKQKEAALKESEEKYSLLFNKMLDGYALHEIICDNNGNPVDYRFLDINPAFEKQTGLKAEKLLEKTVLEVLPGTESYWIKEYGKVALTGIPSQFENYANELNKYFEITAFCPKKNQFACIFKDITERKLAIKKIRVQSKAMDAASIGIIISSIDGITNYSNNTFNKMYSYKENELIGKPLTDLVPDDKIPQFKNIIKKIINENKWQGEISAKRKNGQIFKVMMYGAVVKNENKQLIGFIGIYEDITEKKIIENKLKELNKQTQMQNDFLINIIDSFHDPFYIINIDNYMIEMANTKARSIGITTNKPCYKLIHKTGFPCSGSEHPCTIKKIIKSKKPVTLEHTHLDNEGKKHFVEVNGYPIFNKNGKIEKIIEFTRDITEQKLIENTLRESEEKYRRLTDNSPDMIYRMRLVDGQYEYVSKASEKIFGYTPLEWYDNPYLIKNILLKEWMPYFKEKWENLISGNIDPTYEYQIIHKDGSIRWINQRNILLKDNQGNPTHIEGIVTDITEKKITEEKIKDLALFPEENDNPVFRISKDAKLLYINNPGKRLMSKQLIKIGEDIPEEWKEIITNVWKNKNPANYEIGIDEKIIHFFAKPILDKEYINIYAIDITDQKIAEINLKYSEAKYKLLFEQAAVGVAEIDSNTGKFITINQRYCDIVGYKKEEMLSMDFLEITHPDDLQEDLDNMELLKQGKIKKFNMQKRYFSKDKSIRWVNLSVSPLWQEGDKLMHHVAVVEDITAQKKAEDELKSTLDQNSLLLKEIQHRVKNSFIMISSMISIAASAKKNENEKETLHDILSRINAVSVMYDLLYTNKEIAEVKMDEYLNRLISSMPIITTNIIINKKLDSIKLPVKKAVSVGLITVELITNSIKHAFPNQEKGIINLKLVKLNNKISIHLSDNGIGITRDNHKSLNHSFGLELIEMMTKQLRGNFTIKKDKGTKCFLEFTI